MKEHRHLIIRAKVRQPITEPSWANHFMSSLITAVDMEVLIPPQSVYCEDAGNEGITSIAVITTSHLAMHIWDKDCIVQLDVYSCKSFDPKVVYNLLDEFMSVEKISSALVLRDSEVVAEKIDILA